MPYTSTRCILRANGHVPAAHNRLARLLCDCEPNVPCAAHVRQVWRDRFLAQHAAVVYYWLLVGLWLLSPTLSYNVGEPDLTHAPFLAGAVMRDRLRLRAAKGCY